MSCVEVLATGSKLNQAIKGLFGGRSRDQELVKSIDQEHMAAI